MSLNLIVNVEDPNQDGLLVSFDSPGAGIEQDFVRGDVSLALTHRPVVPSITSTRPWDDDNLSTDTYQIGIGNKDTPPTSGTFPLTVNATTLTSIAFDVSAATLTTNLSATSTTAGYGNVTVLKLNDGIYKVTWTSNGAVPAMTSGTNTLGPVSTVSIQVLADGSASTQAQQLVSLRQSPVAYCEPSTQLPAAAIAASVTQAGDGTHNKIYAVTMTDGTYGGSFSMTVTNAASASFGVGVLSALISASDLLSAILSATSLLTTDVSVTRVGDVFNIEFMGTQGLSNTPVVAVTNVDLLAPSGVTGVMDLNTVNLYLAFAETDADTLTFDFSIRRTRVSGEEAEYFIHNVTLKRNLLDPSSLVPLDLPTYYTQAQSLLRFINSGLALGITQLVGGTSASLDNVTASDALRGRTIAVSDSTYGFGLWQLANSTQANSPGTGYLRPLNYDGSTNHNVWIRLA